MNSIFVVSVGIVGCTLVLKACPLSSIQTSSIENKTSGLPESDGSLKLVQEPAVKQAPLRMTADTLAVCIQLRTILNGSQLTVWSFRVWMKRVLL